jgi:hypothetical protein
VDWLRPILLGFVAFFLACAEVVGGLDCTSSGVIRWATVGRSWLNPDR